MQWSSPILCGGSGAGCVEGGGNLHGLLLLYLQLVQAMHWIFLLSLKFILCNVMWFTYWRQEDKGKFYTKYFERQIYNM